MPAERSGWVNRQLINRLYTNSGYSNIFARSVFLTLQSIKFTTEVESLGTLNGNIELILPLTPPPPKQC